jgi:hypothetical protein
MGEKLIVRDDRNHFNKKNYNNKIGQIIIIIIINKYTNIIKK